MTVKEAGTLVDKLVASYPASYAKFSEANLKAACLTWANAFPDDAGPLVMAAVNSFILADTKGFPPVPGQIRAKIRLITGDTGLSDGEAWNLVVRAMQNAGYEAAEEFAKLPPIVQRVVGNPAQLFAWSMMDSETVHSVVASNFRRGFRVESARQQEIAALPPDVRKMVDRIAASRVLPGGG